MQQEWYMDHGAGGLPQKLKLYHMFQDWKLNVLSGFLTNTIPVSLPIQSLNSSSEIYPIFYW